MNNGNKTWHILKTIHVEKTSIIVFLNRWIKLADVSKNYVY